ncbi:hypothetical protein HRbin37_02388 [bacterium HR37]|nr:hypothetical protein HRbin37_02388 [bacterium HR37]
MLIEISLIKDRVHYHQNQLDIMEQEFLRNFMLANNPELEAKFKPTSPEIRIHIRLFKALPQILFKALGEDLCDSINRNFLNAFTNPNSEEPPSLIFHFVGDFSSFEFKVSSRNEDYIMEASKGVIDKLLSLIDTDAVLTESYIVQNFQYQNGNWVEIK